MWYQAYSRKVQQTTPLHILAKAFSKSQHKHTNRPMVKGPSIRHVLYSLKLMISPIYVAFIDGED